MRRRRVAIIGNDARGGNYVARLQAVADALEPGSTNEIRIEHDNWCGVWQRRACDCSPDIRVRQVSEGDVRCE
jgi:hypothetical protein